MKTIYVVTVNGVEHEFDSIGESAKFADKYNVMGVECRKVEA